MSRDRSLQEPRASGTIASIDLQTQPYPVRTLFAANDRGVWMTEDFAGETGVSTTLPDALFSDLV